MSEQELAAQADSAAANQDEHAASSVALDEQSASSTESTEGQNLGTEGQEAHSIEEDPNVELSRATKLRFSELTQTINSQAAQINNLQQKGPVEFNDPGMPREEDFENDDDFLVAKGAYQGKKETIELLNQNNAAYQQQQANQTIQGKIDSFAVKRSEAIKSIPDFQTVVQSSLLQQKDAQGNLTPATMAILEADNGPEVAYHIATHPEIASSLNFSTPVQAAMTVARLSIELISAKPANINKNPPPVGSEGTGAGLAATSNGLLNSKGAVFE